MKIVFEIGANWGGDTERMANEPDTFVYAFEPTPELANHLREKFSNHNNVEIIEAAVDEEEGDAVFHIAGTSDWGCSSLYEFDDEIADKWPGRPDFHFTDSCIVKKIRLDNFIQSRNIEKIDYLWIDAQGNDFRVLKSLGSKIDSVIQGKCEGSYTVDLYKNIDNSIESIQHWLSSNGFITTIVPDNVNKEADVHFKRLS